MIFSLIVFEQPDSDQLCFILHSAENMYNELITFIIGIQR